MTRIKTVLAAFVATAAGSVALAVPAQAASPVIYSNPLSVTVSGSTVTASTGMAASQTTTASQIGVCARSSSGANVDFPRRSNVAMPAWATINVSGTQTFAAGTYTAFPCIQLGTVWTQVYDNNGAPFPAKSFTVGSPTAPTPTPTPTPTTSNLSTATYVENFDTPAALGQFDAKYPGLGNYNGTTPGDTSKRGVYDNAKTDTVTGGVLSKRLHYEAGAYRVSANLLPAGGDPWSGTLYGTYELRLKATVNAGDGNSYKIADLMWPGTDDWADGEIDWPELNDFTAGAKVRPASKQLGNYNSTFAPATSQYAATSILDGNWHTSKLVWTPDSLTFYWDGVQVAQVTDKAYIPTKPMRWVLQGETNISGSVDTTDVVTVDYDYAAYWKR